MTEPNWAIWPTDVPGLEHRVKYSARLIWFTMRQFWATTRQVAWFIWRYVARGEARP